MELEWVKVKSALHHANKAGESSYHPFLSMPCYFSLGCIFMLILYDSYRGFYWLYSCKFCSFTCAEECMYGRNVWANHEFPINLIHIETLPPCFLPISLTIAHEHDIPISFNANEQPHNQGFVIRRENQYWGFMHPLLLICWCQLGTPVLMQKSTCGA
jgi:hypothetical protein